MTQTQSEWMDGKRVAKILGFLAVLFTMIPWIAADYWWIRMFDFPHLQLTILTAIMLVVFLLVFDFDDFRDYFLAGVLLLCFIYQGFKLFPYTAFAPLQMQNASERYDTDVSLFTANVLQKNEEHHLLIEQIDSLNADVMLFTETDKTWQKVLSKAISSEYQYRVEYPLDNTYGMVMYSKLELIEPSVQFLVSDSIPSIHTKLKLRNGEIIQLFSIHPTPPMPQENPMSIDRDAEMMKIAKLSRKSKLPVAVLGDFNDVAWSSSSKLFQRTSELLDPRIGRGFYSTFNAKSKIMRWPLDHVFVSNEFRFMKMMNTDDIGSDHFPMYVKFSFEPEKGSSQAVEPPTKAELERAEKEITQERNSDQESTKN